jgi:hypothetical protein
MVVVPVMPLHGFTSSSKTWVPSWVMIVSGKARASAGEAMTRPRASAAAAATSVDFKCAERMETS